MASLEGQSSRLAEPRKTFRPARSSFDESFEEALQPTKSKRAMYRSASHVSGPDAFEPATPPASEHCQGDGEEIYDRLSRRRKHMIVLVMSFCAFLSPLSSTSVLAATPEVAKTYNTTGTIINVSNAAYMALMSVSPIVWGPVCQVYGRRPVALLTASLFFLLSIATALAPNLAAFYVFRALSAFEGTAFMLLGAACIGYVINDHPGYFSLGLSMPAFRTTGASTDIYRPTERGTALGWYMSGALIGPAIGPFLGGIIVTYSSWRTIFWLQTALSGLGLVGVFFMVPETIHHKKIEDLKGLSGKEKAKSVMGMINPIRVLQLFRYRNQLLVGLASSALLWNMYGLLTPIRYVLNPRFHLESPMLSGLFYLAPGCGYVVGTFMGGRWADSTVKRYIRKRNGLRIPEDRLRSSLPFIGVLIPGCVIIYGWAIDKEVGGIPLPVITLFLQGVGQLFCFPSLNSYCLDVMPGRGAETTAANYFIRYVASCVVTAVVLPAIDGIGVGWFETISALLLMASALGLMAVIRWGKGWRESVDGTKEQSSVHDSDEETSGRDPEKADGHGDNQRDAEK